MQINEAKPLFSSVCHINSYFSYDSYPCIRIGGRVDRIGGPIDHIMIQRHVFPCLCKFRDLKILANRHT